MLSRVWYAVSLYVHKLARHLYKFSYFETMGLSLKHIAVALLFSSSVMLLESHAHATCKSDCCFPGNPGHSHHKHHNKSMKHACCHSQTERSVSHSQLSERSSVNRSEQRALHNSADTCYCESVENGSRTVLPDNHKPEVKQPNYREFQLFTIFLDQGDVCFEKKWNRDCQIPDPPNQENLSVFLI